MSGQARRPFEATGPLPDGTLLLEASAGTGKTYTITTLVLRLVAEQRIALDRILVVTFTRAAAAELRGRVRGRVAAAVDAFERARDGTLDVDALADDDAEIAFLVREGIERGEEEVAARLRRLREARERFDDATIDTIHGFCQRTLQQAAPDVDVDLGAELTEDLSDLVEAVVHDVATRELRSADADWYRALSEAGIGRGRLTELAERLEAEPHLRVLPEPDGAEEPQAVWSERVAAFRAAWREQGQALTDWLLEQAEAKAFADHAVYNRKKPSKEQARIDAWCEQDAVPFGVVEDADLSYVSRRRIEGKLRDPTVLPAAFTVVDAAEALLDTPADLLTRFQVRVAHAIRDELARRKAAAGVLSFTDLLRSLERALSDPGTRDAVRAAIRARFDAALIDEFQDTDPVQWNIFASVFGGADGRLHLVGDPKQAIYAFRGADVHTYLAAARSVPATARFTLPTNHRSDQRYLDALERLFGREDAFAPDGVFATPGIDHVPVRAAERHAADRLTFPGGPRPTLELRFVPRDLALTPEQVEAGETIRKGWAAAQLPRHVASEVLAFLRSGAELPGGDGRARAAAPGDVAVLTRTNHQARRIQAALQDVGLPAVIGSDQSVFDTPEAVALQRLLDALLQPGSDRAVRPALAGPVLGRSAAELVGADDRRWDGWVDAIERWGRLWRDRGLAVTLRTILAEEGTARRLVGEQRGARTLTNLLHLGELLHEAESARRLGPEGLAAWLREQRLAGHGRREELEQRLEDDAEAVQVVTVHRAKGLQYPVVWCPFLWEGRLLGPGEEHVLRFHHPDDQQLTLDLHVDADRPPKSDHVLAAARERWEEGVRLAYVALTRAQHRCVVHTGPFTGSAPSALARLLHAASFTTDARGRPTAAPDPTGHGDAELLADLHALATDDLGVTTVAELAPPRPWTPPPAPEVDLAARRLARELDRSWQRTSFSRLTHDDPAMPSVAADDGPDAEGRDHDQAVEEADAAAVEPTADAADAADEPQVPLAAFPRGAEPGTFLHGVLEDLDFTHAHDAAAVDAAIADRLDSTGLAGVDRTGLRHGLQAVLTTPLGEVAGERALADVPPDDRLNELAFDLPLAGGYAAAGTPVTLSRIADVLERHAAGTTAPLAAYAARLRQRRDVPVRGFLTGSIDLVMRFRGSAGEDHRHLVVDHKSNWLGEVDADGTARSTVTHYHPDRLAEVMVDHDYVLQYHLYLVALHRYLRWRLGSAYRYEQHVAGVAYLFLRGMVGPDTPRAADGTPHGVYVDRPNPALVADLDAVLKGERP